MIETWLRGYLKAWGSDDPQDMQALFTQDARYFTEPYAEPWVGHGEIVREWVARSDSDEDWSFVHEVLAEDGDVAVVRGVTRYGPKQQPEPAPERPGATYHNIWLIRFAPDGRAREFTEWWMEEK